MERYSDEVFASLVDTAHAEGVGYYALILLGGGAGLRRGELVLPSHMVDGDRWS